MRPFYTNKLREIVKQPKVYFYDSGFMNHILEYDVPAGKRLEHVVVMEVLKKNMECKYWRDKRGHEMDFVIFDGAKPLRALEAKVGGDTTNSFTEFRRAYQHIPADIVTEGDVEYDVFIVNTRGHSRV